MSGEQSCTHPVSPLPSWRQIRICSEPSIHFFLLKEEENLTMSVTKNDEKNKMGFEKQRYLKDI